MARARANRAAVASCAPKGAWSRSLRLATQVISTTAAAAPSAEISTKQPTAMLALLVRGVRAVRLSHERATAALTALAVPAQRRRVQQACMAARWGSVRRTARASARRATTARRAPSAPRQRHATMAATATQRGSCLATTARRAPRAAFVPMRLPRRRHARWARLPTVQAWRIAPHALRAPSRARPERLTVQSAVLATTVWRAVALSGRALPASSAMRLALRLPRTAMHVRQDPFARRAWHMRPAAHQGP